MKVLTVKQPYASLIVNGYKRYEFRSWKTSYRGELYIHAGKSTDKKRLDMVKDYDLEYQNGYIIGKVNLVDCILVDEEMNKELQKINPNIYNHNHTGMYAWCLEECEELKKPIKTNGKLSIWNYEEK